MIDYPESTSEAGALLRELVRLPVDDAIALAKQTDEHTFLPPSRVTNIEDHWWQLCDAVFSRYREAASLPGVRLQIIVERALDGRGYAPDVTDLDATLDAANAALCPRWPSGIHRLDKATAAEEGKSETGGAYGAEAIGGEPGAGKSLLALDQAMMAAATGWRVVYFDTELSIPNLRLRLDALKKYRINDYFKAMTEPHRKLHFAGLDRLRGGFGAMSAFITDRIMPNDDRVLVVVDHVHDAARGLTRDSNSSTDFYRAIERIGDAAKHCRKESSGYIGWIMVCELNRDGKIRGGQIDYAADLILSLSKESDSSNVSTLRVPKGREGGDGPYGRFYLSHEMGRLVPLEEKRDEPARDTEAATWDM